MTIRPPFGDVAEKIADSRRRHTFMLNGVGKDFTVDIKYSPLKMLGSGAYGVVAAAYDGESKRNVAIKQVANVFDDETDALRVLREIKLLRHFHHPNIVTLYDIERPISIEHFRDLYMVMEHMDADLHKIIHSKPRQLTEDHIRYILVQLLSGVKHMHSAGVIHRDLKPSNILLNSSCDLRICDLGLSRGIETGSDKQARLTEYVVTRWYRAPEILCSSTYSYPVDMWAIGCIFAEMLRCEALFPGENSADMLNRIHKMFGSQAMNELRRHATHQRAHQFLTEMKSCEPIPLEHVCFGASKEALSLLGEMLRILPEDRITIDAALNHPFLEKFNSCHIEAEVEMFRFDFEKEARNRENVRRLMYEEILDLSAQNGLTDSAEDEESSLAGVADICASIENLSVRRSRSE